MAATPTIFINPEGQELCRAYVDLRQWMVDRGGCANCQPVLSVNLPENDPTVPDDGSYYLTVEVIA